ncbi:hypothetical protein C8F01DRAFT_206936 [Mycena amicta]|nr:hypothetical protein C8F01DRAFT_206102 [Mycena amicta]KAJ7059910.1 hypothetical protein C8F01DRAFT_206936 [Mycena amicta]
MPSSTGIAHRPIAPALEDSKEQLVIPVILSLPVASSKNSPSYRPAYTNARRCISESASPFYRDPNRARELGDGGRREAWAGWAGGIESGGGLLLFRAPFLESSSTSIQRRRPLSRYKPSSSRTAVEERPARPEQRHHQEYSSLPRVFLRAAALAPATTLHTRCEDLPPPPPYDIPTYTDPHPRLLPPPSPASSVPFHYPHRLGRPRIYDAAVLIHENEQLPPRSPDARSWDTAVSRTLIRARRGLQLGSFEYGVGCRGRESESEGHYLLPDGIRTSIRIPSGASCRFGWELAAGTIQRLNSGRDDSPPPMDHATLLIPSTLSQSVISTRYSVYMYNGRLLAP